jgi:hypothetical protein
MLENNDYEENIWIYAKNEFASVLNLKKITKLHRNNKNFKWRKYWIDSDD